MVGFAVGQNGTKVTIVGHGLQVPMRYELAQGVAIIPEVPDLDFQVAADSCRNFVDYAAVIHGHPMATFAVEVTCASGGEELAVKAWNALYVFHRLSLAAQKPCLSLYAEGDGVAKVFSATSPTPIMRGLASAETLSVEQLEWAAANYDAFDDIHHASGEFAAACRCLFGAPYLPDSRVRTMLLWAGIEGLLGVEAELSRRIALFAALLFKGTEEDKHAYYDFVRKAYGTRSRIVHGKDLKQSKLMQAENDAYMVLTGLLRRAVELGRVPTPEELDRMAVAQQVG